jgi:creatinine amidohydrolase
VTDRDNLWQNLTRDEITEARDAGAVVAIPIGAIEQHGSHLPVDTDARLSTAITRLAASRVKTATVLVAPSLPYGFSPHHLSHAGTISLRLSTYLAVLGDIASSLAQTGFRRIVFVNGHGGNSAPLRSKIAELVTDGIPATGVDYWAVAESEWLNMLKGGLRRFGHACEFETSLMLAVGDSGSEANRAILKRSAPLKLRTLQPWVVPGESSDPISEARAAWPPIFQGDDAGYHGDPAAATVETGEKIMHLLAGRLAEFFDNFAAMPIRLGTAMGKDAQYISLPTSQPAKGAGR